MNGKPYGEERRRLARQHKRQMNVQRQDCNCDWCEIATLLEELDRLTADQAVKH